MTPLEASLKGNEKVFCSKLQDKRKNRNQRIKWVTTSHIRSVFSKGDNANNSYELHTISEVIFDTSLSYRSNYLPESYNENLLRPTKLTLDENNQ